MAILDAAATLFAEEGYQTTTLAAVGKRAGVSRGTPGYFFGSKAELYQAVLEHCFAEATAAIRVGRTRALKSGRPAADVLAGAVSDYVDFVAANPAFVRLIQREALGEGTRLESLPLGQAAGSEAVTALAQELGFPNTAQQTVSHLVLSLLALTWFPMLHAGTLVPAVGLDATTPEFLDARKHHITTLLLGALPSERMPSPRRSSP
jgi:TetR/AcrR family transcriptional regulator